MFVMSALSIHEVGRTLGFPSLLYLSTKGGWISEDDVNTKSADQLLDLIKQRISKQKWDDFTVSIREISAALPHLTLKKIERYCSSFGFTDVELSGTKKHAIVSLYLRNPAEFTDAVRMCETYRMGSREVFSVKASCQSRLRDFDADRIALALAARLEKCPEPVFKEREIMVKIKKADSYWQAIIYYEQRPKRFRVFKHKKIESVEVRPVALLQFSCHNGSQLEVKGRNRSAVESALPIISEVMTKKKDAFEPDISPIEIRQLAGYEFDAESESGEGESTYRTHITRLVCQITALSGAPYVEVEVPQSGIKPSSEDYSIESVANELLTWTQGKLDILRAEIKEADVAIFDKATGRIVAKFRHTPNSSRRHLPEDWKQRQLVDKCISMLVRRI
jgi:hypothetical protein